MALCLHTLGQAGPLISAQGYINDVSTVATIHHAEKLRDASLPGELQHSVSRERTLLLECLHVCVCLCFQM